MECLVTKRKRHEAHVLKNAVLKKEWLQARRQQHLKRPGAAYRIRPSFGVHRNSKEAATEHYERKYQQKTKTRHPPRSVPHSAISEGHCLNCLLPYSPNHTHQGACTFHPGFITAMKAGKNRGYKWTCCGRRTAEHRATVDLHTRTGCSSGRTHVTHGEQEDVPLERQKRLSKPITLISLSVDNHTNIISYLMTYVYIFYPISCNIIVNS